jgi:lysophospholipase L1-like esterase
MRVRGNRLARSFGAAGAALTIVLFIEQQWAAHHDFPSFPDLDPSGLFGNPAHPPRRIALLGDSTITAPGLESADDIWIRQLVPDLSDGYRLQIESVAFGGARLSDVVNNQIPELSGSYDLALVSAGSNDALRGMTQLQMRQILTQICEQLLERCEAAEANERIFHIPMWELTTPAYRTQEGLFSDDRFHPNRRGHAIWAGAALPTLRAAFELSSGATR